jgi:hypothetical protein
MNPATASRALLLPIVLLLITVDAARAQPGSGLAFIAVGDAGAPGPVMTSTAASVNTAAERLAAGGSPTDLLIFLGDNFYPHGLNAAGDGWKALREEVIGPYRNLMARLGRENVRAVAGNHDYYCRAVNAIPYGFCVTGNEREREMPEWTFDYYRPRTIRRALVDGGADSVEFIFFDSSYLLTRPTIFWRRPLDSLEEILRRSAVAPGVRWRLFVAHHSPRTIGEHAGWRAWLPALNRVGYLGNCVSEGQDPFRYVYEFFSTQDNCSERYRRYNDTLYAIIDRAGARIQALIAGHEHSLQLMHYPTYGCEECPKVFVVSGAGSKRDRVKSPAPPHEFSHPLNDPAERGRSAAGFVTGVFEAGRLKLQFIDGSDASALDMGGGKSTFIVDESGSLVETR